MSKIKDYVISAMAIAAGVLYIVLNHTKAKANQYKRERNIAQTKAEFAKKRNKVNENKKEIEENVATTNVSDIDKRLRKYTRNS